MSEWISVKTKLPKAGVPVLGCYRLGSKGKKQWVWTVIYFPEGWRWMDIPREDELLETHGLKVTHWQPQPKPPKRK